MRINSIVMLLAGCCATMSWDLPNDLLRADDVVDLRNQSQIELLNASEASAPRQLAEIHVDLRRLERETSKLTTDAQRSRNIVALCRLFIEIGQHPDVVESPTLQSLSIRLRTRLRGIERRTVNELKRRHFPEPEDMIEEQRSERRQRAAAFNLPNLEVPRHSSNASGNTYTSTSIPVEQHHDLLANRGNAAPGPDYGWGLVNLIRNTIQPDYWSVAGGPGKAIYFGHSRALVIHGSWRIHEDVADLLAALRGG